MKRLLVLLAVALPLLLPLPLWAWDAQALLDVAPTAALVQTAPTAPWMQSETTTLSVQGALSHLQTLAEGLSLSGTAWAMANSLPSGSPLEVPSAKIDLESRILELKLAWEAIPGTLIWDAGKKVIHPSSGFFRTPLNVLSRGALSSSASSSGAAVGAWEEGWVGTEVTWLVGSFTVSNFFSPRLNWSTDADRVLQYVSLQQDDYQDLTRVDLRIGDADVRLLGLLSTNGSDLRFQAGAGVDTNVGEAVTVRSEIAVANTQDRLVVTDDQALLSAAESVKWAPRALAGFTWTNADQLSIMAEYYYNGAGFVGSSYAQLITYSQNRRNTFGTSAHDLLDQFGSFSAAQHYGFVRVSGPIDSRLTAAAWTAVNLQDFSGLTGIVLTLGWDRWSVNASALDAWGRSDTEAGLSPLLWKLDFQVSLYL